jgi:hypothetical protein
MSLPQGFSKDNIKKDNSKPKKSIEICRHHFYIGLWIAMEIVLIVGMISNYQLLNTYNFNQQTAENKGHYMEFFASNFGLYFLGPMLLIVSNALGFIFANMRYQWFKLKDCNIR